MIDLYQQQYNRALRLHETLCKRLYEVSGALVPVYERPPVVANKVSLVQQTKVVCDEVDKMLIQIEIAEEIAADADALGKLDHRLDLIEEIV
jgi:hypothetical protein